MPVRWKCAPALLTLLLGPAAPAQVQAHISRKLNIVKARPRAAAAFADANIGQALSVGDNLRTGLRSQAELQYTDRSTLRIPSSSDVVIRTGYQRDVNIQSGAVYGNYRGPGRFRSRDAVAAVRGTRFEVDAHGNRTLVRCFSGSVIVAPVVANVITGFVRTGDTQSFVSLDLIGAEENWVDARVDYVNAKGTRVAQGRVAAFDPTTGTVTLAAALPDAPDAGTGFVLINPPTAQYITLKPGEETSVSAPLGWGPLPPRPTAPDVFAGGEEDPEFQDPLFRNEQTMVAGLVQERRQRAIYELIVARDASQIYGVFAPGIQSGGAVEEGGGSLSAGIGGKNGNGSVGAGIGNGQGSGGGLGTGIGNGPGGSGGLGTGIGGGQAGNGGLGAGVGGSQGGNGGIGIGIGNGQGGNVDPGNGGIGVGVGNGQGGNGGIGVGIGNGQTGSGSVVVSIGNGQTGTGGLDVTIGRAAGGRAIYPRTPRVGGIGYSSTATDSASGYADASFVVGRVYVEAGGRYGLLNRTEDSQLDTFFLRYRDTRLGDVRVGRFHWFPGPISNGELGRLTSFTTADGVLWRLPASDYAQVQLAYWDKINPLYGPRVGGYQARVEVPTLRGRTGLTLLAPRADHRSLGYAFDTIVPILPQKIDLYGEGGADTLGKGLYAIGIYLPGLFHFARVDFALEYAHRGDFDGEFDLSASGPIGRYVTGLFLLSKPDHTDWRPSFGLQVQF